MSASSKLKKRLKKKTIKVPVVHGRNSLTRNGQTPLSLALKNGNIPIRDLLLESIAKKRREALINKRWKCRGKKKKY